MGTATQTHVVKKGEKLALIAKNYGFSDWKVVWNDKANDGVRKLRKKPEDIDVGDKIVIPPNPAEVKQAEERLRNQQAAVVKLRQLRVDAEKSFQKMEKELEGEFEDMEDLSKALDLAALIATAFVGAAAEGAQLLKGVQAAEKQALGAVVKGGAKVAALEIAVGIAQPSWWADKIVKRITGQDNKTAFKIARDQLLQTKAASLTNIDLRIRDLENAMKEGGR